MNPNSCVASVAAHSAQIKIIKVQLACAHGFHRRRRRLQGFLCLISLMLQQCRNNQRRCAHSRNSGSPGFSCLHLHCTRDSCIDSHQPFKFCLYRFSEFSPFFLFFVRKPLYVKLQLVGTVRRCCILFSSSYTIENKTIYTA